jgi:hypothetical protein
MDESISLEKFLLIRNLDTGGCYSEEYNDKPELIFGDEVVEMSK